MLFILARMQSMSSDIYEAAEIDGATPLQQFRFISLPQLMGIMAVLFLLRFIWTFNKFDDIFLLTGGAAGTRTSRSTSTNKRLPFPTLARVLLLRLSSS